MKYTKEQELRITEAYNRTHSPKELADELGVTVAQLRNKAAKMRCRDGADVALAKRPVGFVKLCRNSHCVWFMEKTADGWKVLPKRAAA